ncbi:hypothetical protein PTKIN_Ptkin09bG0139000 [Pterospermum kingtungense]
MSNRSPGFGTAGEEGTGGDSMKLSYYVFIAYTCTLATLVLLLVALFLISKTGLPPFKFPLISRLVFLALIGPILSFAISNLIPAFTFILAVFFSCPNPGPSIDQTCLRYTQ